MNQNLHYSCTALAGTNKVGLLKPDENGYYTMVLGALEYPNSRGDIYTLASAQKLFEEGSALLRRIRNGQLRAEYGHPKQLPGQSLSEYTSRILTIYEEKVCAHISEVWIDYNNVKDKESGKAIITFLGKVKPCGPYGHCLKEILDDPKQNAAFSVRSITSNRQVGFRLYKDFTLIVTWDYVNEPGLAPANKFQSPALEALADGSDADIVDVNLILTKDLIESTKRFMTRNNVSMESMDMVNELEKIMLDPAPSRRLSW